MHRQDAFANDRAGAFAVLFLLRRRNVAWHRGERRQQRVLERLYLCVRRIERAIDDDAWLGVACFNSAPRVGFALLVERGQRFQAREPGFRIVSGLDRRGVGEIISKAEVSVAVTYGRAAEIEIDGADALIDDAQQIGPVQRIFAVEASRRHPLKPRPERNELSPLRQLRLVRCVRQPPQRCAVAFGGGGQRIVAPRHLLIRGDHRRQSAVAALLTEGRRAGHGQHDSGANGDSSDHLASPGKRPNASTGRRSVRTQIDRPSRQFV